MTSDLEAVADRLAEAVRAHARSVVAGSPESRQQAGRDLVDAMDSYGAAVASSGADLPEDFEGFEDWLDEEDGIVHEGEPDLRQRIALFTRTDLTVTDVDRLRSAAASRVQACCPDVVDDVQAAVADPADAVDHLVGHEPTSLDAGNVAEFGLELLAWTSVALAGVPDYVDDPWAPLRDAAE
jgi:hypothetical protein